MSIKNIVTNQKVTKAKLQRPLHPSGTSPKFQSAEFTYRTLRKGRTPQ
ncbi:MAG TPA: hypothetical protein PLX14_11215 [Anaerolineales bacterium]|nr:hypothetical protein [Anaerolineales bacterium]